MYSYIRSKIICVTIRGLLCICIFICSHVWWIPIRRIRLDFFVLNVNRHLHETVSIYALLFTMYAKRRTRGFLEIQATRNRVSQSRGSLRQFNFIHHNQFAEKSGVVHYIAAGRFTCLLIYCVRNNIVLATHIYIYLICI